MTAQCPGSVVNIRLVPVVAGARGVLLRGTRAPIAGVQVRQNQQGKGEKMFKNDASIGCSLMITTPMEATPAVTWPVLAPWSG